MGSPNLLTQLASHLSALDVASASAPEGADADSMSMNAAMDALPLLVWTAGKTNQKQSCWANSAWHAFTGNEAAQWRDALHPESAERIAELCQSDAAFQDGFQEEIRIRSRDGRFRWFLVTALSQKGQAASCYFVGVDIHDRVTNREALERDVYMQRKMLDASVDCIKIVRPDGTLAHMNLSGCRALSVSADSGFGMKWLELLPSEVHAAGLRAFRQALRGGNARFSGKSMVPGKATQYWDNILTPVLDDNGHTVSILCVSRDVTLQHVAEERLRKVNEFDELTELPNRRAFKEQLRPALQQARAKGRPAMLMMTDLDHFKQLNDTLGHAAGDHLLQVVARRIQGCLPETAFVARLGGDEFGIVIQDVQDDEAMTRIAQRVMMQLDPPIHYVGKRINGSMSIGCALYPRDASDPLVLMSHADAALNDMKVSGRGGVRIFSQDIMRPLEAAAAQMDLARSMLRDGTVRAYYQPKLRLSDRRLVGMEALLRSQSTEHGDLQTPGMVQAAFLNYDLATRISDALRTRVFADLAEWQRAGLAVVPISLNAAPVEFMRDNFAERLLKHLDKAKIDPTLMELEVTEQTLDDRGSQYVIRALKLLKDAGIRVALDDFGTGHSSLVRLRDFPVDSLKIDSNLAGHFGSDPTITAVVNAIGQIGNSLSLELVAEGVETEKQCQALLSAGFQIGQGHLFSQAISAKAIADMLGDSATWNPAQVQEVA